jgi:hypothetical protein
MLDTQPTDPNVPKPANVLTIAPAYVDPVSGATYVHQDLRATGSAWAAEDHIPPIQTKENFGDVESWVAYVQRFAGADTSEGAPLLTWSERGLAAILDYHGEDGTPARCAWKAMHSFERASQWNRWSLLANGQARGQKAVLESLEDYADDIAEPTPADLLTVLRTLRATASAAADTELLADGSTKVVWQKQTGVKSAEMNLPPEFLIRIPVLKGHTETNKEGKLVPVLYQLAVRLRASVDDSAHLTFRLSMPNAERVLEAVFADRVAAAQALLGEEHKLYRAAER